MSPSVETAVRLGRGAVRASRTWRFRDARRPRDAPRAAAEPVIYAAWHEHVLPLSLFVGRWGVVGLASRSRDGEIISRLAARTGALAARGSTSRDGGAGAREILRAARAGRSIFITPDGPRGPRRVCGSGLARLAAMTGLPIVPLGLAATAGLRLRTWDRFLVPAPFARIFLCVGEPIRVVEEEAPNEVLAGIVGRRITRAVRTAEQVASEARRGRALAVRAVDDPPARPVRTAAWRRRLEGRLRAAWTRPPTAGLRLAASGFSAARAARAALYRSRILGSATAPIPVVSVGGATVGGSGKTPLAAEVAGWLSAADHRVAMLTRGYPDELRLHRSLLPDALVLGHPDRTTLAGRAAAAGATVAVLDDGLQHLRLHRDVEVLALDRDALRRTNGAPLPAGPFREPPATAGRRADVIVMIGREAWSGELEEYDATWLEGLAGGRATASVTIDPGEPVRVRGPASDGPTLALTGVMKPNLFFGLARGACPTLRREHALPDHGEPGEEWPRLLSIAGEGGILMTGKDLMRLSAAVPPDVSIWVLPEVIRWHRGLEEVRERIFAGAEMRS